MTALNVRCYRRLSSSLKNNLLPTVAVLGPQAVNKLSAQGIDSCSSLFKNIVYIVIARSKNVPEFMKTMAEARRIPVAASFFDEYYLTSSIKGMIRETVRQKTSVHGVVIEAGGTGMLIAGASGIGKTTAALEYVQKEGYWIADDLAVIHKNRQGELVARGHAKIRKYLHYGRKGIIPVSEMLPACKIRKETRLSAIIRVEKTGIKRSVLSETKMKIINTVLPCINTNITASGYFDKNLLEKAIKKLKKAGH